jgi:SNF2 family DNA or RNA helicase
LPSPKPYQLHGANWLAQRRAGYLADEMRLGKSVQTVLAMSLAGSFDTGEMNLIVAPASAVYDWPLAFKRWSPESPSVVYANLAHIAKGKLDFRYYRYDVVVMSYECLSRSIDWLSQFNFNTVVFDEAHYLKKEGNVRTKAAFGQEKVAHKPEITGIAQKARRVWCLSGTPMPNHPGELWTVSRNLWPEAITNPKTGGPMNQKEFEFRYVKTKRRGPYHMVIGGKNLPDLKQRIAPYFLRRTSKQVAPEMDPITYQVLPFHIRPMEPVIQVEADALRDALAACKTDVERIEVIKKAAQFDNLRSHLAVFKALEVSRRIGDECYVDKTLKQVVMGWHVDALKLIARHCKETGLYPLYVDGETPPEERGRLAREFRENPKHQVFVGQLKAAGTGVDLSAAHIMTFNDMSHVPGDNVQASFRIMSITATMPKTVRIAYAEGTVDEQVSRILRRKIKDQVALFSAGSESELAEALSR